MPKLRYPVYKTGSGNTQRLENAVPCLWRMTAADMLSETQAYEVGRREDLPSITVDKIRRARDRGYKPRLFLEEIDKVKGTEFRLNVLSSLINAVYEQEGQLVVNTNLTPNEFARYEIKRPEGPMVVLK